MCTTIQELYPIIGAAIAVVPESAEACQLVGTDTESFAKYCDCTQIVEAGAGLDYLEGALDCYNLDYPWYGDVWMSLYDQHLYCPEGDNYFCDLMADPQYTIIDIRSSVGTFDCAHTVTFNDKSYEEFAQAVLDITGDEDVPVLVYCVGLQASMEATYALQTNGFTNVQAIGGYEDLVYKGCSCPVETEAPATGPVYVSEKGYIYPTADDAATACSGIGMNLCTAGQLMNAVFNYAEFADLCYSGWISDTYQGKAAGWFNAAGTCGTVGWNDWAPGAPGAHCCSSELADLPVNTCSSYLCGDQGDYIAVDGAESVYCSSGTCDVGTCCQAWVAAPEYILLPENFPKYVYENEADADAACSALHPDLSLCTQDGAEAASASNSQCASGFWVSLRNADGSDAEYGQGWYVGEDFTADCPGSAVGLNDWAPGSGYGAAHCCVKPYISSGYGAVQDANLASTQEAAEAYCNNLGYSYSLCTKDQLERVVSMEEPSPCMAGWMADQDIPGWWTGEYVVAGCGAANTYYPFEHARAGAHCCLSSVMGPALLGGPYGILPANGAYQQSSYSSGAAADQGCTDAGYDQICTLGQQAYVDSNPAIYGDIACKVGWVSDGEGYDAGYYGACGAADTWNNNWTPPNGNPVAHCCAADTPELEMTAYPYYNGDWDQYTTKDAAAAKCTGEYSLCSKDQLQVIATEGVTYNDVFQKEDSICRIGWTEEGEIGWWQGAVTTCGTTGWRTFNSAAATYHCCLPFEAQLGTTQPPTPDVFVFDVFDTATKYAFSNAEDALAACQAVNAEYNLCADYELEEVAEFGIVGVEGWNGVDAQSSLCYTGWLDQERSQDNQYGWYVAVENGCGSGWTNWLQGGANAGAFCCYSQAFADAPTETEAPTDPETQAPTDPETQAPTDPETQAPTDPETQAPTDPEPTDPVTQAPTETSAPTDTEAPTAVADSLPSSVAAPADCVDVGFSVENFDDLQWCASDGTVYLNGRDTCVASDQEQADLQSALTNVWESSWYLASGECTGDKSYDEATDDQLWITNEMCNNLESDISDLEDETAEYMDAWIQSVVDLINANMANFDQDTQQSLTDYLATLQE